MSISLVKRFLKLIAGSFLKFIISKIIKVAYDLIMLGFTSEVQKKAKAKPKKKKSARQMKLFS